MSDIVERLRSVTDLQRETERSSYEQDDQLALEAADTITRLTAEIERLRTELEKCRQIILETAMEKHP
jgi:phage host-nuclease inhibitor protein Gam